MFFKFPSTPYMELDHNTIREDKTLTDIEIERFLSKSIYVEEKIDGANLGISFDDSGKLLLQNRGSYLYEPLIGQWKKLADWISRHEEDMFDILSNDYMLFGEWCYFRHSVSYDALPDWFIGFDIYDKRVSQFLSVESRNHIMNQLGISIVPMIGQGRYTIDQLKRFLGKSRFSNEDCEGIYLRQDENGFLKYRAKLVRKEFRQNMNTHWSRNKIEHNSICY